MSKRPRAVSSGEPSLLDGNMLGDTIECKICTGRMLERIFSCREGHSTCEDCHRKLPQPKRCPQCRGPFPPNRNRALEEVVQKCSFACKYSCGKIAKPVELIEHQRRCARAPLTCPICDEEVQAEELTAHCENEHSHLTERAEKRKNKFYVRFDFRFETDGADTRCIFSGLDQNDSALMAAQPHAGVWHIRIFHYVRERRITLTFGGDAHSQIALTTKTEPLSDLSTWDATADDPGKARRDTGCTIALDRFRTLKSSDEEEDSNWVTISGVLG